MWYNNKRESEVDVLTKTEYIEKMIENNNGYLFTKDISEYGISKSYLSEFVKKRGLKRVAHGVYIDADNKRHWIYASQIFDQFHTHLRTNKKQPKLPLNSDQAFFLPVS